jgi:Uri superfamily endonuclease
MTADAGGTYALFLTLDEGITEDVGSLGRVRLPRGAYVYAGSAASGLGPRLLRHAKTEKVLHWHVDRLTTRGECQVVGAVTFGPGGPSECRIVELLSALPWARVEPPGFGSSDHRCPGHLVRLGERPELLERAVLALEGEGGHWLSFDGVERPGGPRCVGL